MSAELTGERRKLPGVIMRSVDISPLASEHFTNIYDSVPMYCVQWYCARQSIGCKSEPETRYNNVCTSLGKCMNVVVVWWYQATI